MDPEPQPINSEAQQAPHPSTAAPTTAPNKPVTVAAPKAAPRAMGQTFTISGILEGDEGTEFSPDENREVTDQQMKNVLDEAAREAEEEVARFQETARSVKDSAGQQSEDEDESTRDAEDAVKGKGKDVERA